MREWRSIRDGLVKEGWRLGSKSKRLLKKGPVSIYIGHRPGDDGGMDAKAGPETAWSVGFNADTPSVIVLAAARAAAGSGDTTKGANE